MLNDRHDDDDDDVDDGDSLDDDEVAMNVSTKNDLVPSCERSCGVFR